ncbi:MAG TPA: lipopolysaccharide biosynthesis protein [Burkholderiales bacterium]|nr:lipopolysaccharide biosynthesis protein [Burkholderiales bacterium]
MEEISRKMARGAAWMVLVRLGERVLGLVSTMVLARLLVPEDFGLVALAASLLGLLEIMGAFNFDLALIQNQQAERHHYDTAWTLDLLYGALTAVVLAALAVPAAHFFGDPRLEAVLYVFAACALIQSCKNIGIVVFQKELDFRREFQFILLKKLVGVAVTLVLAFTLRTYWALALGTLSSTLAGVAISYGMHPFRPRLSLSGWRPLMRFSGWMLFSNVMIFVGNRGYDLIIGRLGGAGSLGLYTVAYEISNLPTTEIVWPISKAIFPGFSRMAGDRERLRETLLQTAALVALITIPAGAGVAVLAEPVVRIFLGTKWLAAVPLIQILAVFGTVRAMQAGTGAAFLALGMTRLTAWIAVPHVIVGLPLAAFLLMQYGLQAATLGILAAGAVALALSFTIATRVLFLRLADLGACFWRPLLATTAMVLVELELLAGLGPVASLLQLTAWTLLLVAVGATVYAAATLLLWQSAGRPAGAERILLDRLRALRG